MLMLATTALTVSPAQAQSSVPASKEPTAKAARKKPVRKTHRIKKQAEKTDDSTIAANDDDDGAGQISIVGSTVTNFNCELGDKITVYTNPGDADHIAIRWKNRLHRLHKVPTTTGAIRFENRRYGLVWIDIPAKAMLLDSKKGEQLANECMDPAQAKVYAAEHKG